MVALAPLIVPKILVTSKVEYDCTVLGPGQTFSQGVFVVVAIVSVDNMLVDVVVAGDNVVVVVKLEL